jgi:hypothetical protein
VRIDNDLVIGSDELEDGIDFTNGIGPRDGTKRQQQERDEFLHGMGFRKRLAACGKIP